MTNQPSNSTPMNLFAEINNKLQETKAKNLDEELEEKMNSRGDALYKKISVQDIRDDVHENELKSISNKRETELENKRRFRSNLQLEYGKSLKDALTISKEIYDEADKMTVTTAELLTFIEKFKQNDLVNKYYGLVGLRKLLSLPYNPPVQEIIDAGLVFDFIELTDYKYPEFVYEAVWSLTNITSGTSDQAMSVFNKGGAQKLIDLIDSEYNEIQDQSIWAIGNLAGDNVRFRDKLIALGALKKILHYMKVGERKNLIKSTLWSLSNFCKGKTPPNYEDLQPVILIYLVY